MSPAGESCPVCRRGCNCAIGDRAAGCGHYGCWGAKADGSCPGAPAEERRQRAEERARRTRSRLNLVKRRLLLVHTIL